MAAQQTAEAARLLGDASEVVTTINEFMAGQGLCRGGGGEKEEQVGVWGLNVLGEAL